MNKKLFAILLCVVLVCSVSSGAMAVMCPHEDYDVIRSWQEIEIKSDGHEFVIYQLIFCNDCGEMINYYLANSHLEGHDYGRPDQYHDDAAGCDVITYICSVCGYEAVRYIECSGPPCEAIYWSLRP